MKTKHTLLALAFFLSGYIVSFGQTTSKKDSIAKDSSVVQVKKTTKPKKRSFYLDEKSKGITEKIFNTKCSAAVFYCKRFDREDMIIFKVYERISFGKITPKEYNQLRIYLNRKSIKQTPENHKILIHYENQLVGFKESVENCNLYNGKSLKENFDSFNKQAKANGEYPFESIKEFQRYVRNHRLEFHDEEKYNQEVATYAKQQNNCIKRIETKFETPVYYMVGDNFNYPIKNEYFTWVVDQKVVKNTFMKANPDADLIVIKPNGEYFIKSDFLPDFVLNKLLKKENWKQYKSEWVSSKLTQHPFGVGIVEDIVRPYEFYTSNCY
ncbi:MAG: hypothetical protein BM563_09675 [Bacteroidetes bacterium MedPE-SWsnd-G1]|nr:MAG: hypothetical protein BM563_09675 [Bacteroidetes bacterium MedPE-SWsnd-G1]